MRKFKLHIATLAALGAMTAATPASADIFEYTMSNGDLLTINTDTQSGTMTGNTIDIAFAGADLANFVGGASPSFAHLLTSMTGTRTIGGVDYEPTRTNGTRYHDWMIKGYGDGRINLWSWWGDPVIAGDYVTRITGYSTTPTPVPAPGALGLFALGLAALGFRRRRKATAAA